MVGNDIWARLDKALERQGLSLVELSEMTHISYDTLRGWRTKGRYPQLDDAKRMADALALGIDETFYGAEKSSQESLIERLLASEKKLDAIKEILK